MAANKFATMLHKNTNRITIILVYAFLEWLLILLLLLNSLFSYLIIKFTDYFGLKRPCLWCTRLDHIFEPSKYNNNFYRDLMCDDHANEISKLGYCSNHRKLVESQDMCEDCSSSLRSDCCELSKKLAFFPWMKQVGLIQEGCVDDKVKGNGEENFKCSCCGVILEKKGNFPYFLIKPSWEVLSYPQKENLITEAGEVEDEVGNASGGIRSDFGADHQEDEQKRVEIINGGDGVKGRELGNEEEDFSCFVSSFDCNQMVDNEVDKDDVVIEREEALMEEEEEKEKGNKNVSMDDDQVLTQTACGKQEFPEIIQKHMEFYIEGDDCHLIPVELMDSTAVETLKTYNFREENEGVSGNGDVILDFDLHPGIPVGLAMENRCSSREKTVAVAEPVEINEKKESFSKHAGDEDEQVGATQVAPLNEVHGNAATEEGEMVSDADVNQSNCLVLFNLNFLSNAYG